MEQTLLDVPDAKNAFSKPRKIAVVASAIVACFSTAGLAFGFSALLPQLIKRGAFHDECPEGSKKTVCDRQMTKLTDMFTLAVSLLNLASMPAGAILDRFGPKLTATCFSFFVGLGCIIFSLGGPGDWEPAYYVGFLLLAVSGPCNFNCTLSFGNLFPERAGLITAALVGCFDASSGVFAILAAAMHASGLSLEEVFQAYAMMPLMLAAIAAAAWPMTAVTCDRAPEDPEPDASSSQNGILSLTFLLYTYTVAVNMVCINFFIATAYSQLSAGGGLDGGNNAVKMNVVFGAVLPLGGVVFIPAIGQVIDTLGPSDGYVVLSCAYFLFAQLMAIYYFLNSASAAYVAFVVFSFCRPLFYSLNASFCGYWFGFKQFGKVFGLVNTIAGLANLLGRPLQQHASRYGFAVVNHGLLAAQLVSLALPGLLLYRRRSRRLSDSPEWKTFQRKISRAGSFKQGSETSFSAQYVRGVARATSESFGG